MGKNKVQCQICGKWFKALLLHLKYKHYITVEQYHKLYPNAELTVLKGNKHPMNRRIAKKISSSNMGRKAWNKGLTAETDDRILGGEDNPFYGKEHTEEVKQIISKKNKRSWKNKKRKTLRSSS